MNQEIKAYLSLQTKVSAAFSFFISGMVVALIYHKADNVPTDTVSLAIDLIITCLLTFILNALFSKANLKSSKTEGILESKNKMIKRLSRLLRRPVLFGILTGFAATVVLFVLMAPVFVLLDLKTIPFGSYVALKTIFCALLGGGSTLFNLYAGMCKAE